MEDKHLIIGTAGHVDHGKTSLIKALTGTDPDRLKEEQERGMTIDIGFASFKLPSGRLAGVVDVPGHERFLKNMLAGAGGVDLVLLVVAADEGVMPQTVEHLDIMRLLEAQKGIIALTKADLVEPEWLELVAEDVRAAVQGTFLGDAPIIPVSSVTGQGLPELARTIDRLTEEVRQRDTSAPFRLPVDRVFTMPGFGTIVTGTLVAGTVRLDAAAVILPSGLQTRIRQIQQHGKRMERAEAGSRVALNLAGVDLDEVTRGDVVCEPGRYGATQMIDARLMMLPNAPRPLQHRARIRFYLGTAEILGRVVLLDADSLEPGQEGLVQFRLESPVVAARKDRFVLRSYSPMHTLGGGIVLDPDPARHRRREARVLERLKATERGDPAEIVEQVLAAASLQPLTAEEVGNKCGMPLSQVSSLLESLEGEGRAFRVGSRWVQGLHIAQMEDKILAEINRFHKSFPLRLGIDKEDLRTRLTPVPDARLYNAALQDMETKGQIRVEHNRIRRQDFEVRLSPQMQETCERMKQMLKEGGFLPPGPEDIIYASKAIPAIARELFELLTEQGIAVKLDEKLFFHRDILDEAARLIREHLLKHGKMTVREFRDLTQSSRKYVVPLLEYFDRIHLTKRIGDERVLF